MLFFFFPMLFFFSGNFFWVSEWILNYSWEKKNKMAKFEKNGPEKKKQFSEKKKQNSRKSSEWVASNYSAEKKKYGTFAHAPPK